MTHTRIPVTIITGFLGAGKTTVVQSIIQKYRKKTCVVIENEFGEIGIDGSILKNTDTTVFEISNGCICCNVSANLCQVLLQLKEESHYNHVLIETTGIADPLSVVTPFLENTEIQYLYMIDSVVCVVDAIDFEDVYQQYPELRCQIASADTILINKIDLVTPEYAQFLQQYITELNSMARIYSSSFGNIHDVEILDSNAYSSAAISLSLQSFSISADTVPVHKSILLQKESEQQFVHEYMSLGFEFFSPFNIDKMTVWLRNFLYFNKHSILRAKGIICFSGLSETYYFQAVRGTFMFEQGEACAQSKPHSKLIFIGKYLDKDTLEENLLSLLEKD